MYNLFFAVVSVCTAFPTTSDKIKEKKEVTISCVSSAGNEKRTLVIEEIPFKKLLTLTSVLLFDTPL